MAKRARLWRECLWTAWPTALPTVLFGVHSSSFVSRTFIAFLIPPCLHSVSSVESVTEHLPCRSGRTIELATVEGPKDRSGTPSLQACTLLLGFRSVSLVWDYDCATH